MSQIDEIRSILGMPELTVVIEPELDFDVTCESQQHDESDSLIAEYWQIGPCSCLTGYRCFGCAQHNMDAAKPKVFCMTCMNEAPAESMQIFPLPGGTR